MEEYWFLPSNTVDCESLAVGWRTVAPASDALVTSALHRPVKSFDEAP
jgi:hypothetical protein